MLARLLVTLLGCGLLICLGAGCGRDEPGKYKGQDKPVPAKKIN